MTEGQKQVKIIVDQRELRSPVVKALDMFGIDIELKVLEVGDYVLSDRVKVERKTVEDFYNSLFTDRKLYSQLFDLSHSCERPLLIIEGYEAEMFTARRIDGRAVDGILNSIALMRIPIRYSVNPQGTANIIVSIATKEQREDKREVNYHGKRSHLSVHEQLEYLISSIPDIGTSTAKSLLIHFGTIEAIARAGIGELIEVDGIGKLTAEKIRNIMTENYNRSESK
jgi:Fanconi anemia group M protein